MNICETCIKVNRIDSGRFVSLKCDVYPEHVSIEGKVGWRNCSSYDDGKPKEEEKPKVAETTDGNEPDELMVDMPSEARRDLDKIKALIEESEAEWNACRDPRMLNAIGGLISRRQAIIKQYRSRRSFKQAAATTSEELNKMLEKARKAKQLIMDKEVKDNE
jgi:hypothetical protein